MTARKHPIIRERLGLLPELERRRRYELRLLFLIVGLCVLAVLLVFAKAGGAL